MINNGHINEQVYRSIPISAFISRFSAIKKNALFIGEHITALVNCTTSHASHSVGTITRMGTNNWGVGDTYFDHLRKFTLRYANPKSMIAVYMIVGDDGHHSPICTIRKDN